MATRQRRPIEERVAEVDKKIEFHKKQLEALEAKKKDLLNPQVRTRKLTSIKSIIEKAKKQGMSADEIARRLEVDQVKSSEKTEN